MEIYSPKHGNATRFSQNVLKSETLKKANPEQPGLIIKFEKVGEAGNSGESKKTEEPRVPKKKPAQPKENSLVNYFYEVLNKFFGAEEVM
ncbi:MAG TPA: hypothetical protein PKW80_01995 [Bacteroidales bacterium]|nr:hypothetical protein [Bacteroidales bacterium]